MNVKNEDVLSEDVLAEQWFQFRYRLFEELIKAFERAKLEDGLQQKDVAARLGKSPSQISRWLRGQENMNIRSMHDMARAMNCRLRVHVDNVNDLAASNSQQNLDPPWQTLAETGSPLTGSASVYEYGNA